MICPKGFIVILLVWLVILTNGCLSATSDYPKFLSTNNEFQLEIQANVPLHNATFYLPLPVRNSQPAISNSVLNIDDLKKEGYIVTFTRTLPTTNINVTHPEEVLIPGNYPWYVRIHADSWPNGSYRIEIRNGSHDLSSPQLFINTLYPIGNESIILPKWDFSPPEPMKTPLLNPLSDLIGYTGRKSKQSTWIYSYYSTDPNSLVTISIHAKGTNQWLDAYDNWITNNYDDFFYGGLSGENTGEYLLNGEFTVGNGYYPDLSSSKWQRFIQRNQQGG